MAEIFACWCVMRPPLPSAGEGSGVRAAVSRIKRRQNGVDQFVLGARKFVRDAKDFPALSAEPSITFGIVCGDVFEPVQGAINLDDQPLAADREIDGQAGYRVLSAYGEAMRQAQFAENLPSATLRGARVLAKPSGASDSGGPFHPDMSAQVEPSSNHRALSPGPSPAFGRGGRTARLAETFSGGHQEVSHG